MTELAQSSTDAGLQAATKNEAQLAQAASDGLQFMFGVQALFAGEMIFVAEEMRERTKTETHLLSEFLSKVAGSHSLKDLRAMYAECSRHQLDFFRRDSERMLRHGEWFVDATSRLFNNKKTPG